MLAALPPRTNPQVRRRLLRCGLDSWVWTITGVVELRLVSGVGLHVRGWLEWWLDRWVGKRVHHTLEWGLPSRVVWLGLVSGVGLHVRGWLELGLDR